VRKGARELFSEFWPYTRGDRLRLLGGGLLSLVLMGAELGTVVIFEAIVGRVLEKHHLTGFWVLAGAWLAMAAAGALAMAGSRRLAGLAAGRVQLRLRDSVFSRAQRLPADYFDERRLGDLLIRLTDDVAVVEGAIASGPVTLVTSAVSIVVFAAAALVIRWDLALVAFAAAPAFWLLARGFSGPLSRAADAERAASGSLASAVEESLSNQALIQAFNRQDAESERLHREGASWLRATMAETKLDSVYEPLVYFLETCCVLLVFAVGAWDVAGGRLSAAGLLAFAACLAYLYPPVQSLSGLVLSLSEASASAARIGDILGVRPAVAEVGSALRWRLLGLGRRGGRRGPGGRRTCVHHHAARQLRHAGRPSRPPAVRRPAPANLPGPGLSAGRAGAGPGRADHRPGRGQCPAPARGDPPVRGQPHGHSHHPRPPPDRRRHRPALGEPSAAGASTGLALRAIASG